MAEHIDRTGVTCVVGAGSSGITAAKNLLERDLPVEVIERENAVGGNWYYGTQFSSVYASTHLISSKPMTQYTDYPFPEEYPDYPNHVQVLNYLRSYADHFGVTEHIRFNTAVDWMARTEDGCWDVTLSDGSVYRYSAVIIANGHHWNPRYPRYAGSFGGVEMHATDYKTPDILRGKRVLVIGAGNSGCDIAVEAAQNADLTYHSTRRGYWYIPKYVMGRPADQVNESFLKLGIPRPIRQLLARLTIQIVQGSPERFGLPKPDHPVFSSHPIINSQLFYHIGHGDITPKPDVQVMGYEGARFVDGSVARVDIVIYATGYKITFPFIDKRELNWQGEGPQLWLHAFHPTYDNLFVAGLIQPDSGQFGLVDLQCQVIARYLAAREEKPAKAEAFRQRVQSTSPDVGGATIDSPRHFLEVDHWRYRKTLKRLARQLA